VDSFPIVCGCYSIRLFFLSCHSRLCSRCTFKLSPHKGLLTTPSESSDYTVTVRAKPGGFVTP